MIMPTSFELIVISLALAPTMPASKAVTPGRVLLVPTNSLINDASVASKISVSPTAHKAAAFAPSTFLAPALSTNQTASAAVNYIRGLAFADDDNKNCYRALEKSDKNRDGKITVDEYVAFVKLMSPVRVPSTATSFDDLPTGYYDTFTKLACLCINPDYFDDNDDDQKTTTMLDCCVGDKAHLAVTRNADYLKLVCGSNEDKSIAPTAAAAKSPAPTTDSPTPTKTTSPSTIAPTTTTVMPIADAPSANSLSATDAPTMTTELATGAPKTTPFSATQAPSPPRLEQIILFDDDNDDDDHDDEIAAPSTAPPSDKSTYSTDNKSYTTAAIPNWCIFAVFIIFVGLHFHSKSKNNRAISETEPATIHEAPSQVVSDDESMERGGNRPYAPFHSDSSQPVEDNGDNGSGDDDDEGDDGDPANNGNYLVNLHQLDHATDEERMEEGDSRVQKIHVDAPETQDFKNQFLEGYKEVEHLAEPALDFSDSDWGEDEHAFSEMPLYQPGADRKRAVEMRSRESTESGDADDCPVLESLVCSTGSAEVHYLPAALFGQLAQDEASVQTDRVLLHDIETLSNESLDSKDVRDMQQGDVRSTGLVESNDAASMPHAQLGQYDATTNQLDRMSDAESETLWEEPNEAGYADNNHDSHGSGSTPEWHDTLVIPRQELLGHGISAAREDHDSSANDNCHGSIQSTEHTEHRVQRQDLPEHHASSAHEYLRTTANINHFRYSHSFEDRVQRQDLPVHRASSSHEEHAAIANGNRLGAHDDGIHPRHKSLGRHEHDYTGWQEPSGFENRRGAQEDGIHQHRDPLGRHERDYISWHEANAYGDRRGAQEDDIGQQHDPPSHQDRHNIDEHEAQANDNCREAFDHHHGLLSCHDHSVNEDSKRNGLRDFVRIGRYLSSDESFSDDGSNGLLGHHERNNIGGHEANAIGRGRWDNPEDGIRQQHDRPVREDIAYIGKHGLNANGNRHGLRQYPGNSIHNRVQRHGPPGRQDRGNFDGHEATANGNRRVVNPRDDIHQEHHGRRQDRNSLDEHGAHANANRPRAPHHMFDAYHQAQIERLELLVCQDLGNSGENETATNDNRHGNNPGDGIHQQHDGRRQDHKNTDEYGAHANANRPRAIQHVFDAYLDAYRRAHIEQLELLVLPNSGNIDELEEAANGNHHGHIPEVAIHRRQDGHQDRGYFDGHEANANGVRRPGDDIRQQHDDRRRRQDRKYSADKNIDPVGCKPS